MIGFAQLELRVTAALPQCDYGWLIHVLSDRHDLALPDALDFVAAGALVAALHRILVECLRPYV
jgi:hypothetical protein